MFIETKDIFTVGPTTSGRPFINESRGQGISVSSTFLADKRTLMNWIKRTPEAIGIIRQFAMDIVTRLSFVAIEKPRTGGRPVKDANKNSEFKAQEFAKSNFLKSQLRAAVIEGIALGDGYLWKGTVSKKELKKSIKQKFKEQGIVLDANEIESKAIDEDYVGEKSLQYVASATMSIRLHPSGTKIQSFIQRTNLGFGSATFPSATLRSTVEGERMGDVKEWLPEQIIHYKFMEIDGKVHGFTPMQSSFPVIKTLGMIKDYHGHFFDSGISPDIIFNFEELGSNSVEYEKMRQVIQEWYDNKRRSFAITTSKMKIEKLNEWNKDMEFRMLAIYYTGVIAFSLGMPLEKIRAILGGEIKSTTGGSDISNTDYQRNIYDIQDDWEQLLNTQFFNEEFGVDIKFERSAARDEMAEVQRDSQKLNWIGQMFDKDLINEDDRMSLLKHEFPAIPANYWNPDPKPEMDMMGMIPSSKAIPGQAQQALSDEKRKQQLPQQKNKPPQGI